MPRTMRPGSGTKASTQRHHSRSADRLDQSKSARSVLDGLDVGQVAPARAVFQGVEETAGAFQGDDASGGADDLGQIERGVAGA